MALTDFFRGELIDIIEWTRDPRPCFAWRDRYVQVIEQRLAALLDADLAAGQSAYSILYALRHRRSRTVVPVAARNDRRRGDSVP